MVQGRRSPCSGFGIGLGLRLGRLQLRRLAGLRSLDGGRLGPLDGGLLDSGSWLLAGRFSGHLSRILTDMSADNDPISEPTLFSAVMTPHRSLGRKGFMIVMLAVAGVSFVAGLVFLIAGAWPVTGFFGLDVALVYWAFRANYRAASAYEQIVITPTELVFRKVSGARRDDRMARQSALGAARPRCA